MICKNCIHYDICQYHIDEETKMTVNECGHFKHKDQIAELPCYIGQRVWTLCKYFNGKVEIEEGRVSMLQQKADKSWKFRVSIRGGVADYTLKDLDIYIFLSYDTAVAEADRLERELNV